MRRSISWRLPVCVLAASLCAAGCRTLAKDEIITADAEANIREADFRIKETSTLSGLAKLEEAVAAYYKSENKIPGRIEDLIPKYLAEIPTADTAVRWHRESSKVQPYPSDVLRDGQVDGSRLKDTGRWGYVFNDRQVVVFVDCTHKDSRGRPWYQERGVY